MKKKLFTFFISLGLAIGFSANAVTCDGTARCLAVHIDCIHQGLDADFCMSVYWACAGTCEIP